MVLPEKLLPQAKKLQRLLNRSVNAMDQRALARLIEQGAYVRRIHTVCKLYKRRCKRFAVLLRILSGRQSGSMAQALASILPQAFPVFGSVKAAGLLLLNAVSGLSAYPIINIDGPSDCSTLILGFGHLKVKAIIDGVERLKKAIDKIGSTDW
ncbi:MAG: hypothetical protein N2376_04265 [Clostridia bacterium]|nr:hypothetical protein [Clostridia bacterium]